MIRINWKPSPGELRRWACLLLAVLGVMGALFYFVDWGIFARGQRFAIFLWCFAVFAFTTGVTGTRLGWPAYWLWMGFVYVMAGAIGYTALTAVYVLVLTPMALLGRLCGRDRLGMRNRHAPTFWHRLDGAAAHNPERQF